jgi:hypothetical protein
MTVAELIERLRDLPVDAIVQLYTHAPDASQYPDAALMHIKSIELSADHIVIIEAHPEPRVGHW